MKHPDAPDIGALEETDATAARVAIQVRHDEPRPLLRPPRRDRLERRRPAAGPARHCRSMRSAGAGRRAAATSCATCSRATGTRRRDLDYVVEPARARAPDHGDRARGARPRRPATIASTRGCAKSRSASGRVSRYRGACSRATRRRRSPRANATNGTSCRRAARATSRSPCACAPGTRRSKRDAVVAAHGGTARALIAVLGIASPDQGAAIDDRPGRGLPSLPTSGVSRYG